MNVKHTNSTIVHRHSPSRTTDNFFITICGRWLKKPNSDVVVSAITCQQCLQTMKREGWDTPP